MTHSELAKKIYDICHLEGDFLLRSGTTSHQYFDKYRFEAQPELLNAIADQLVEKVPAGTEAFAALEMGGIPIATALSLKTGIPCVFVRKEAKTYGTCQFAEGLDVAGKRLCIIEDVITTGGQVEVSTNQLRELGAEINDVLCVIYRGEAADGQEPRLEQAGLKQQSLFTKADLING